MWLPSTSMKIILAYFYWFTASQFIIWYLPLFFLNVFSHCTLALKRLSIFYWTHSLPFSGPFLDPEHTFHIMMTKDSKLAHTFLCHRIVKICFQLYLFFSGDSSCLNDILYMRTLPQLKYCLPWAPSPKSPGKY